MASRCRPRTLELLTKLDEGWAAGLRLAAISIGEHPDPGQFIKELAAENSAITGYLIEEALNNQPAQIRDLLLKTSILDRVSSGLASELTGHDQAASDLAALARANAFVQPLGNGWYRYHSLFAEVLRLKLRLECPGEVPDLHRRAARWYQVNGLLLDAVRQAVAAGDWPLAAQLVLDELAIGQLIEPHSHSPLADCFRQMPNHPTWTGPQPALITAALALADLQPAAACAALDVAEGILERLPAEANTSSRLAAATLRLARGPAGRGPRRRDGSHGQAGGAGRQAARRHPVQARRDPRDDAVGARGAAVLVGDTSTRPPRASRRGSRPLRDACPSASTAMDTWPWRRPCADG